MKGLFFIFTVFLLAECASVEPTVSSLPEQRMNFLSKNVGDSFDIHITLPAGYDSSNERFQVVYYMDANLKSGNKLREIIDDYNRKGKPVKAIFVGVGHFSNYRELRRRDFITPFNADRNDSLVSDDKFFGQSEHFYLYMKNELIPYIEKNYRANDHRSLIGHSLGGLFAFYCLFRNERLFTDFVALSPALWINYGNIYKFEKKYHRDSLSLHANLYLCAGTMERLNKILDGARTMNQFLEERKYSGLNFIYKEFEGESHNSEVPLALDMILHKL